MPGDPRVSAREAKLLPHQLPSCVIIQLGLALPFPWCNVPFPLGSRNTVVVYPFSRKPLNGQAREMTLVKSLLSYKAKLRKSEFMNIKPLLEDISSNY
jgi:hypothetical protein